MADEEYQDPIRAHGHPWTPNEIADLLEVDNPGTLNKLIKALEDAGHVLPNLGAGEELHDALLLILGVGGGYEELTRDAQPGAHRRYLDVIDGVGHPALSALARKTPRHRGKPARPHWYAPGVGLDRVRHPWDPVDLVEQLEAAAMLPADP